jgi:hypothetical protein
MIISRSVLLVMGTVSARSCTQNQTHILYSITFFPRKSFLKWDVEKYDWTRQATVDSIIRRVCIACWIIKATDTHSEYVITYVIRISPILLGFSCTVAKDISAFETRPLHFLETPGTYQFPVTRCRIPGKRIREYCLVVLNILNRFLGVTWEMKQEHTVHSRGLNVDVWNLVLTENKCIDIQSDQCTINLI